MRAIVPALVACFMGAGAVAQTPMKPTAPQKMMSPAEQKKMQACEKQAADRNVPMDQRSKFVMDCMTKK
jgi:hypothetical protein